MCMERDLITFERVVKQYNKTNHIGAIDLSIKKGEIFALCGGNGAGKSTIIKMLTGILKPTSGKILLNGKVMIASSMEHKRDFSYMPDDMLFPQQLTGNEVLHFFGKLRGVSGERIKEVLQIVGLEDARDKFIRHYSKGMQQRLSLAQALLPDVGLLILDEPTNGLDPYWVYRFKELIVNEKKKGKTILFTTHILTLVEEIADRAAFMENGKVMACDTVANLTTAGGTKRSLETVFFEHQMKPA